VLKEIKVSVIIPTYKRSENLRTAIESVLHQTHNNVEIIVVDDNNPNSKDRKATELVMASYKNENKVLYFKHNKNKNGAAARNTGIANCTGDFISFLDDDDELLPEKIRIQLHYLIGNKKFHGVYCGSIVKGKNLFSILTGDLSKELLLMETILYTPSLMFRREAVLTLKGFNETYSRHQDYEFLLRFFQKFRIGAIEQCLVVIGDNQGENRPSGKEIEAIKEYYLNQFEYLICKIDKQENRFRKKVYAKHFIDTFFVYIHRGNWFLALRIAYKYLLESPVIFFMYAKQKIRDYLDYNSYKLKKYK